MGWQQCLHNGEFRQAVADRLHKHFYNGGALAPESIATLLNKRVNELRLAVICESARWVNHPRIAGRHRIARATTGGRAR